jgi:hypothetical protein
MPDLSRYLPSVPPPPPLVLARADAFFVRRVDLVAGEPAAAQARLALEGMAPFPPEQLYFGQVAAGDGASMLVFAAFRRRFSVDETEAWERAAIVTPEFAPMLSARPSPGDAALLHVGESRINALAWRAGEELPAAVLCRIGGEEQVDEVLAEVFERAALRPDAEVRRLEGPLSLVAASDGVVTARAGGRELGVWPAGWSETADIREPEFLVARRRAQALDQWLWRGLLAAAAVLVLAAALDIGAGVLGALTRSRQARIAAQAGDVQQTEMARTLADRIAELNEKRLMPFEMMDLINAVRPDTVVFQRAVTRGLLKLEVEAQAQNTEDVGRYANALRILSGVASANTRDIRAREGVTTFVLEVEFKPEALRNGGAL